MERDRRSQQLVVAGDGRPHQFLVALPQLGGAVDVAEQEGHYAGGKESSATRLHSAGFSQQVEGAFHGAIIRVEQLQNICHLADAPLSARPVFDHPQVQGFGQVRVEGEHALADALPSDRRTVLLAHTEGVP